MANERVANDFYRNSNLASPYMVTIDLPISCEHAKLRVEWPSFECVFATRFGIGRHKLPSAQVFPSYDITVVYLDESPRSVKFYIDTIVQFVTGFRIICSLYQTDTFKSWKFIIRVMYFRLS